MTKEELLAIRKRLIMGDPPYEKDDMGNLRRRGGVAGLHERKSLGDHDPNASGVRLALETLLALIDDRLEKAR